jgi:hypothetical protein
VVAAVTAAGFTITEVDVFYEKGAPKTLGADSFAVSAYRRTTDAETTARRAYLLRRTATRGVPRRT